MRIIAHFDMDAFFAAIEERDKPRFKGFPIVVGADPLSGKGRGVVSTANYKAREYGIHSALPISTAWRLSEIAKRAGKAQTIFVGVNMEKYVEESGKIMEIIKNELEQARPPKFPGGNFERASVDEAYADLTFTEDCEKAKALCEKIKKEVKEKRKLTVSVGVGPNKLIAKICSGKNKPDGLTIVREENAEAFLETLSIREIPGIGPKTEEMFLKKGVKLVRDLKKFSKEEMKEMMGKWGLDLYEKVRGRNDSPIVEEYEAKSIGEEETFSEDSKDAIFISKHLERLCEGVFETFSKSGFKSFRTIAIKIRFSDFETKTRAHTLPAQARIAKPVSDKETLKFEALRLLSPFLDKRENSKAKKIRLIGVRVEKLV